MYSIRLNNKKLIVKALEPINIIDLIFILIMVINIENTKIAASFLKILNQSLNNVIFLIIIARDTIQVFV